MAPRLASPLASPLPLAPLPHDLPSSCPLRFHRRRSRNARTSSRSPYPPPSPPSPPPSPPSLPSPPSPPPPPYKFTSKASLQEAARAFNANPASAEATYGPIAGWDVSAVTDMSSLFYYCKNFNANISNWDTSSVTDMSDMFNVRFATRAMPPQPPIVAGPPRVCAPCARRCPTL